jgi:hypothetical protein
MARFLIFSSGKISTWIFSFLISAISASFFVETAFLAEFLRTSAFCFSSRNSFVWLTDRTLVRLYNLTGAAEANMGFLAVLSGSPRNFWINLSVHPSALRPFRLTYCSFSS